jgi:isopenicillin N synthase-like dioxygenase
MTKPEMTGPEMTGPEMDGPSDFAVAARTDFTEIPVIDISALADPDRFDETAHHLVSVARDIGFFYLTHHGIPAALCEDAFAASREFFGLSDDQKADVSVDHQQRGWMAQGMATLEGAKTSDAKEVFFWGRDVAPDDPDVLQGRALVAPNQWPDRHAPRLKQQLLPYYDAVLDLSRLVLRALARGLGKQPDFFAPAYVNPLGRGQLVYYPPQTDTDRDAERFGAAAHSDFGVLTILMQDNAGGLQVLNKAGIWIEAPPLKDSFVCNIGDLLERWTNGQLVSTKHRVVNRTSNARFSIPIFCDPASEAVIDPRDFDELASYEAFAPCEAGQYIQSKNTRNFSHYKKQD